jgi:hypothetical protein
MVLHYRGMVYIRYYHGVTSVGSLDTKVLDPIMDGIAGLA